MPARATTVPSQASRPASIGARAASRPAKRARFRCGRDRAFARGQGSDARSAGGALAAEELAHSHRASRSRRDAIVGGEGRRGDEAQSALCLAGGALARRGAPAARPRAGDGALLAQRRRRERDLRGGGGRRSGTGLAHRWLGRAAGSRLSRLFSRPRHLGARPPAAPYRDRAAVPRPAAARN